MITRCTGRHRTGVRSLGAQSDRHLSGRQVDDGHGNEKRRDASGAFLLQNLVIVLDRPKSPDARSDIHTDFRGLFRHHSKSRIFHRQLGSAHGIVDERIHFLDFFFLDELGWIEVFHFTGDLSIIRGRIEFRNSADAGFTGTDSPPGLFDTRSQRCDQPQTGHHNSPGRTRTHHVLQPLGLFLDIVQRFPNGQNLLCIFVGNLDTELFFEGHHQLNRIE